MARTPRKVPREKRIKGRIRGKIVNLQAVSRTNSRRDHDKLSIRRIWDPSDSGSPPKAVDNGGAQLQRISAFLIGMHARH